MIRLTDKCSKHVRNNKILVLTSLTLLFLSEIKTHELVGKYRDDSSKYLIFHNIISFSYFWTVLLVFLCVTKRNTAHKKILSELYLFLIYLLTN